MITVVMGPPCSGKSTFVRENARFGDVVIDMDRIALALSVDGTEPFEYGDKIRKVAREARKAAVKSAITLAQGERYWGVWIIHTDPSPDDRAGYRAMGARLQTCDPGEEECLRRLESRPIVNQVVARDVIKAWYGKR